MAKNAPKRPDSPDKGVHQNIARAALVLSALAKASAEGLRLTDVTQITKLSKTAAHRCLAGLTLHGLASYEPDEVRFFLGDRPFAWTVMARKRFELAERAMPYLRRLADETEDTVYFTLRRGEEAICYGRAEGEFPIKTLTLNIGDRRPLGIGSGSLAIMAFLSDQEIERLLEAQAKARAQYSISDKTLRKMIVNARAVGYATNQGYIIKGMSGVGVPLRNDKGVAVAALSIAAISPRLMQPRKKQIVARLQAEAERMQKELTSLLTRG